MVINFIKAIKVEVLAILSIIVAFLTPIIPLLLTVGLLIALDTIVGILRARKTNEKVTSRKLSKVVSKMFLYQSSIILFYMMERFIIGDFIIVFTSIPLFLTKIIAIVLCYIELKSLNESYELMTGRNIWNMFKELLSRGKEIKGEIKEF